MGDGTNDVLAFLRARAAEDRERAQRVALDVIAANYGGATMDDDPEWVAEMVESLVLNPLDEWDLHREIAAAYSDHPDYRQEWRP